MARDAYSKYSKQSDKIMVPDCNYAMGERKSLCYEGAGWYVPSERRWEQYHEHRCLPVAARRDALDFQREEEYMAFVRRRDRPRAPLLISYIPNEIPEVKWNGHRRMDTCAPPHGQFRPGAKFPHWDGPGYYGYYHEALDRHGAGEFRTLPALRRYPGYPVCRL